MIEKNKFKMLNDKEKAKYKLKHCILCDFYRCELITEYIFKRIKNNRDTDFPIYMQEAWENEVCAMKQYNQVECGNKWVADGIGEDFKIDTEYNWKTEQFKIGKSSYMRKYFTDKWEPRQPVFISAQTGGGKNHFIENELLPYIRILNHDKKTEQKVLILNNRIALYLQTKDRIENGIIEDDKIYYDYRDYADVLSYQSLLNKVEALKKIQTQKRSSYIFVICDEAHFFTSDAMFNPYTERILSAITNIFTDAIRVYMSATLYECLPYIQSKESKIEKSITGVLYHFKRDYNYLNTKYFSDEKTELRDIIINSVVNNNEKWLIFIDNTKQCAAFKNLLENNDGEATALKGKVLTISTESKNNDKKYQQMIRDERFNKDINVVITTSVVDNGVNFRDIENVVITDINRTKCLQMVGRVRIDKNTDAKVTLYIKRHNESDLSNRLKDVGIQQDAYHDYDMAMQTMNYNWAFLNQYYDHDQEDRINTTHLFGRDKNAPNNLYPNEIARSLVDKQGKVYKSILEEIVETDVGSEVTGQKYLEYMLSWFGKEYDISNDITLNGYKPDNHIGFEKWLQDEWLDKKIAKEELKDFGKKFFEQYYLKFGYCTKNKGFSSDDNRGKNGPKAAGYSINRIKEIFAVKKMQFEIIENNGDCVIKKLST